MADDPSAPNAGSGSSADRGLRLRMAGEARRVHRQHARLAALMHDLRAVLEGSNIDASRRAFARFTDALDAHMRVEETVYFPALHGLLPEVDDELSALIAEHREMRAEIAAIGRRLAGDHAGAGATAVEALDALTARSARHEAVEEALIDRVRAAAEPT